MAIAFRRVTSAPLDAFEAAAPDGVAIGIVGESGSGKSRLLRLAAGVEMPASGRVHASGCGRLLGPTDPLENLDRIPARGVLSIDGAFAAQDLFARERAIVTINLLRRRGVTTLLVSH